MISVSQIPIHQPTADFFVILCPSEHNLVACTAMKKILKPLATSMKFSQRLSILLHLGTTNPLIYSLEHRNHSHLATKESARQMFLNLTTMIDFMIDIWRHLSFQTI